MTSALAAAQSFDLSSKIRHLKCVLMLVKPPPSA